MQWLVTIRWLVNAEAGALAWISLAVLLLTQMLLGTFGTNPKMRQIAEYRRHRYTMRYVLDRLWLAFPFGVLGLFPLMIGCDILCQERFGPGLDPKYVPIPKGVWGIPILPLSWWGWGWGASHKNLPYPPHRKRPSRRQVVPRQAVIHVAGCESSLSLTAAAAPGCSSGGGSTGLAEGCDSGEQDWRAVYDDKVRNDPLSNLQVRPTWWG